MKNPPGMNTGNMPSTTVDKHVGAKNKHSRLVNGANLMVQGESKSRMNQMNLKPVSAHAVESGDNDCSSYT